MPNNQGINQVNNVTPEFENNRWIVLIGYINSFIKSILDSMVCTEVTSDSNTINWPTIISLTLILMLFPLLYFFYKSISACCIQKMNCSGNYSNKDEVEAVVVGKDGEIQ